MPARKGEPEVVERRTAECKKCGKAGLHWDDDGDGSMILMEGPWKVHNCKQADVDAFQTADFEKLD